ncbi:hypothetical protein BDZ85DRAFT_293550 [Elsinoe ampelina]|uniref:CRIB domain-containing protein n=1 Tax=Elsinoe ampelina TaxID=302913 RepID=A0A6A6GLN1_9PEZI|nr:hypothetical protein BDZ85DRAFT_293550 [Elsinoe ampelina]
MAPKWLQFTDESGKRASMLSVVSNRRTTYDDSDQVANAFAHPFFDQDSVHEALDGSEREPAVDRAPSKKRYSLFARSIAATSDGDSERPSPEPSRHWPRLPFQDKQVDEIEDDDPAFGIKRNQSRKSMAPRSTRHEPILRWMRRVERSASTRPSTPFGFGERARPKEEDRELKKASISSPFNFQHVAHTAPQQLPELDLVSDRDLTLSFWAASAHQQPQGDLRGIKAEEIENVQRQSRPPSSLIESRPISSSDSVNFSRIRSSSIGREAAPRLRASRSLSNASATSNDEGRRTGAISRSASLASLIAEPRSPPTMLHPAFRTATDAPPLPQPPMPWMQPSGIQTPCSEMNRNLDVVPEEIESQSPRKTDAFEKLDKSPVSRNRTNVNPKDSHLSVSTVSSDGQDTNTMSQYDMSVPSLSSGETWEEDVDFCYNMEAESTCDFSYGQNPFGSPNPHDSVLAPTRKAQIESDNFFDVSPRVSIAAHQRNRSSMTMTPFLASASKLDLDAAFENPRSAPDAPLPEINRLSSLLDLPMLRTPHSEAEAVSPGKISDQTVTDLRSSSAFKPEDLSNALSNYTLVGSAHHARGNSMDGTVRSDSPDAHRLSAATQVSGLPSRPTSAALAPSPPPSVPLPPIPKDITKTKSFIAAKRNTVAAAPSEEIVMRRPQTAEDRSLLQAAGRNVQHTRTATPPRLVTSRSVETPSLRALMKRSQSSPSVNDLYKAHALPKTAEKFPVWI